METLIKKLVLSIFLMLLFTLPSNAQPGRGWGYWYLKDKLELSDEQEARIEKLRAEHQKEMIDLRAKLEKARLEMREVTAKENFSRSEYLAAHNKLAKIREEIQTANANHRMDVLDLLNKDQRKMFSDFKNFGGRQKWIRGFGAWDCPFDYDGPRLRERRRIHW